MLLGLLIPTAGPADFDLEEATIAQLAEWQASGRYTSRRLVERYLSRIDALDARGPALHAMISLFGRVWSEARLLARAYESATRHRRPPRFLASAPGR